jgi:hypothetical protein
VASRAFYPNLSSLVRHLIKYREILQIASATGLDSGTMSSKGLSVRRKNLLKIF